MKKNILAMIIMCAALHIQAHETTHLIKKNMRQLWQDRQWRRGTFTAVSYVLMVRIVRAILRK